MSPPPRNIGPYEVLGVLGKGATSVVYRARHTILGRDCALKALVTDARGERRREIQQRFVREARALAGLDHPGILRVHDVFESAGQAYLVTELVSGRSLREILDVRKSLPPDEALALMEKVARAIHVVHERGVIHRDLKPGNVMVDPFGMPTIVDFGLVSALTDATRITRDGSPLGTPNYMAPEQARGEVASIDGRTDVWALGVVLYELLAGEPPFEHESLGGLFLRIEQEEPSPPLAPDGGSTGRAGEIALLALAKDRSLRPTALALAEQCAQALADSRDSTASPDIGAGSRRRAAFVVGAAVLGLGAVGLGVGLALRSTRAPLVVARSPAAPTPSPSPRATPVPSPTPALGAAAVREHAEGEFAKGELEAAARDFSRALELEPGDARTLARRATVELVSGRLDAALEDADRAIELAPRFAPAWAVRGDVRRRRHDLDRAVIDLDRAIELDPQNVSVLWSRGELHRERRDVKRAMVDFDRAIAIAPGVLEARVSRGDLRRIIGEFDGAIADFTYAIEHGLPGGSIWLMRGVAHVGKAEAQTPPDPRELDLAIEDDTRAVELGPHQVEAWFHRGVARLERGDLRGAVADFDRAIECDRTFLRAWLRRGSARLQLGDWDGAIEDETRAIDLDATQKSAWVSRALAHEKKGQRPEARADLVRARALGATGPDVDGLLERLKE